MADRRGVRVYAAFHRVRGVESAPHQPPFGIQTQALLVDGVFFGGYLLFGDHALRIGRAARFRVLHGEGRHGRGSHHVYAGVQPHRRYGGDSRHRRARVYFPSEDVPALRILRQVSHHRGHRSPNFAFGLLHRLYVVP